MNWGWEMENGKFSPIMTDNEAGPPDILKVIRCGCEGTCGKRCSCRKAGLKCTSLCKECNGIICTNAPVIDTEQERDEEDRNFLDIFNQVINNCLFVSNRKTEDLYMFRFVWD